MTNLSSISGYLFDVSCKAAKTIRLIQLQELSEKMSKVKRTLRCDCSNQDHRKDQQNDILRLTPCRLPEVLFPDKEHVLHAINVRRRETGVLG